ncbi:MAG: CsgG/HfaB family protein [Candidatus Omnitrophota bacterium]
MKRLLLVIGCAILIAGLTGCASRAKRGQVAGAAPLPAYAGDKARVAVADFEVKAAKATREIGSGVREMLVTALVNSKRFSVVERQELNAIKQEQQIAASADAQAGNSGPQKGKIKAADLIIAAAVTEFEPQTSGGRAGIGGGGGVGSGILGGLLGAALNKSHMALDIRIVDTATSEVLAATRVQGQASDVAGSIMGGFFGSWGLGTGLSGYANTPMEKAIRICIIEAVRYLSQTIPEKYYKY